VWDPVVFVIAAGLWTVNLTGLDCSTWFPYQVTPLFRYATNEQRATDVNCKDINPKASGIVIFVGAIVWILFQADIVGS
jgi:hypothetical protein